MRNGMPVVILILVALAMLTGALGGNIASSAARQQEAGKLAR